MSSDASSAYIQAYYPSSIDVTSAVWKLQERWRCSEAKRFSLNPERSARGWTALEAIQSDLNNSTVIAPLPTEFISFAQQKTQDLDEKRQPNVRRTVKDIWTWPLTDYLPWNSIPEEDAYPILAVANQILTDLCVVPRLVEGKIYLVLSGFRSQLWKTRPQLANLVPKLLRPLRENIETEHITIVNSEVVAKVDSEKLNAWLTKWQNQKLDIKCTGLRHTVSLDWARFGVCLVAALQCDKIKELIEDWNTTFQTNTKVSLPHITIAIDSRA